MFASFWIIFVNFIYLINFRRVTSDKSRHSCTTLVHTQYFMFQFVVTAVLNQKSSSRAIEHDLYHSVQPVFPFAVISWSHAYFIIIIEMKQIVLEFLNFIRSEFSGKRNIIVIDQYNAYQCWITPSEGLALWVTPLSRTETIPL